jgi:hypothetical protein
VDDTFWNRTRRIRMYGPATSEEWQRWKAGSTFPVNGTFYLRGTSLLIQPTPTAGDTVAYEYRSSRTGASPRAARRRTAWALDTDTGKLDERLMASASCGATEQNRGLDWQTDYDKYSSRWRRRWPPTSRHRIIDFRHSGPPTRIPGVVIPEGYWNL